MFLRRKIKALEERLDALEAERSWGPIPRAEIPTTELDPAQLWSDGVALYASPWAEYEDEWRHGYL